VAIDESESTAAAAAVMHLKKTIIGACKCFDKLGEEAAGIYV